ncbi:hypothetical protein KUF71_018668 [Frankliniella fusca]|uniref:RNA-directed DNA polymerase n=1 Tax=Frankliniella fusca TaxID=407009 RepID=A0AAE1GRC8_9NEOP|nr:hypothetical protein KUF71_018668 [Frankliniella fusca]
MANAGGRFPSFDPTAGKSWSIYYQRFVYHCKSKKITTDEGMKAEFIASIEDETFEYVQALVNKQLSDDTLTFANIAAAIEQQYVEPDNEIEASAAFHLRNQQPGESVKDYVAELRRLAVPCRFGSALERTLRDRIVLGISSVETRALLFRTPKADMTVEKVIAIARSVESSQRQAIATSSGTMPVHFMGRTPQTKQGPNRGAHNSGVNNNNNNNGGNKKGQQPPTSATPTCRRCDGAHEAATCKYKNTVCDFCNIKGHIAAACNSRKRAERQNGAKGKPRQQPQRQQPANQGLHATSATGDQEGVPTSQGSGSQNENLYYCEYSFFYLTEQEQTAHISATEREAALKLPPPLMKTVHIDGKKMEMELDQGCPIALINETTFNANWPGTELEPVPFQLQTWTYGQVGLQGFFKVTVTDGARSVTLPLFVGPGGGGRPLLGRQWFAPLGLRVVQDPPVTSILYTPQAKPRQSKPATAPGPAPGPAPAPAPAPAAAPMQPSLPEPQPQRQEQDAFQALPKDLREYECLRPGLGMYKGKPVSLEVDLNIRPKFCKARKVPFARRGPVEQEIQRNVDLGVWRGPVPHSKWATAIVPVFKPNRGPRLCGDYRSTLNQALPVDNYPMPTIEEAFASLAGSSVFTKLDLKEAYTQVPVDEASARLLTVSTHKGLFTVHRLPFGISVAPTLFQRVITSLLSGIEGVVVWLDDLLISGKDTKTHDARLKEMGCYAYSMEYRPGKDHGNCDALSRLPIPGRPAPTPEPPEIFLMTGTPSPHLTAADVAAATAVDPTLSQVLEWTRCGWPQKDPGGELSEYFRRRDALSTMRDCLLWGKRVVVPAALHDRALRHLHAAHMGIVRTKALARVLFWWPGLSTRIEHMVGTCSSCQATRPKAPHLPVSPWPRADAPWSRLHIDYAGPFRGRYFLVLVDAYSGWCDAFATTGPTTEATITCLNQCFRYNGSPFTLVSDNGTAFTSHRFRAYCAQRGIKQLFTAPRCPSSNGAAERLVRTLKETLRRLPGGDLQANLDVALDSFRQTPGQDGRTPWEKLCGRPVRTALSLVRPAPVQAIPELAHKYAVGDAVHYKRHGEEEWRPAAVLRHKGAKMLILEDKETTGYLATRHSDQIRRRVTGTSLCSTNDSSLSSPQAPPPRPFLRPSGAPAVLLNGTVFLEKEETAAKTPVTSSQGTATGALVRPPSPPVQGKDLGTKRRRSSGRGLTPLASQLRREEARRPGGPGGPEGPREREPRKTRNPDPNYKVEVAPDGKPYEIPRTRAQYQSPFWDSERAIRVTASKCKAFLSLTSENALIAYFRKSMWGFKKPPTAAMQLGIENEPLARNKYVEEYMSVKDPGAIMWQTGSWVSPQYPKLIFSPDGIIHGTCVTKLFETKYCSILQGADPNDFKTVLTKKQQNSFYLRFVDDKLALKESHPYNY